MRNAISKLFALKWQDVCLGDYPGVKDSWLDVISSQGSSLLSVDLSGSEVTDSGLAYLKDCPGLQGLTLNYCDQFSENGLKHISGSIFYFLLSHLGFNSGKIVMLLIAFMLCLIIQHRAIVS